MNPYTPPAILSTPPEISAQGQSRRLPQWVWVVGVLLFPCGTFFCLRIARVISTATLLVGLIASLAAQLGIVPILAATEGNPLQIFIELLLGACFFILGMW